MGTKYLNPKIFDEILDKMVQTVDNSKKEIIYIGEQCRNDYQSILEELNRVKTILLETIREGDELEKKARQARKRLAEVSRQFNKYTEEEVREAYEYAHSLQVKLTVTRQFEKQLKERRDEMERRIAGLKEMIQRADNLVSQVNVVQNYLTGDLKSISDYIHDTSARQEFGLKIFEAQEEERKRLSREIHDGPAQMLANMMMRADFIEKIYTHKGMEEALKEIKELRKNARDALYEVRHIIYNLRPMALDDLGLVPVLKKYLNTIEDYHKKPKINFVYIGSEERLPSKMEAAVFRLIQESVQNALKHSEADTIEVKLEITGGKVNALVKDDGKGFDVNQIQQGTFGILGMKERVELLNGTFRIQSKIGEGTTVFIGIPIKENG